MSEYECVVLAESAEGVILPIKAKPAARKNELNGVFNGALKVSVTTAPEKGKANKAIVKLLSKIFNIPPKHFTLLSGETAAEKRFLISSVSVVDLQGILRNL